LKKGVEVAFGVVWSIQNPFLKRLTIMVRLEFGHLMSSAEAVRRESRLGAFEKKQKKCCGVKDCPV
jgi:hypothetical protein